MIYHHDFPSMLIIPWNKPELIAGIGHQELLIDYTYQNTY